MDQERILTTAAQAKAVQDVGFLGQFTVPTSPSDAARRLGIPANLAHHHAQRHLEQGLLEEVGREHGKVQYQLTAKLFKVPRDILPAGDPDNKTARTLGRAHDRFLKAYARSDRLGGDEDPDYDHYGFARKDEPDPVPQTSGEPLEPRPAHFLARTFSLSPEGYRKLVQEITALISAAENEHEAPRSGLCTLVFLGMDGPLQAGTDDSRFISSFVPLFTPSS